MILKRMKRRHSREDSINICKQIRRERPDATFGADIIAGFPTETDEDLRQTIDFAKQIEADYYSLSILAPYYGTELYQDILNPGVELDKEPWEYFFHQTGDLMVNQQISPEVLKEYLSLSDLNNIRKGYV